MREGRPHRRADVQVVPVPVAAVQDHHDRRGDLLDQTGQHRGDLGLRRRAEGAGARIAVEPGVAVAQELDAGHPEVAGRAAQFRLPLRAEIRP